jgi:hypothetical protein
MEYAFDHFIFWMNAFKSHFAQQIQRYKQRKHYAQNNIPISLAQPIRKWHQYFWTGSRHVFLFAHLHICGQ